MRIRTAAPSRARSLMPGSRRARWSGIRAVSIATLANPIAASRRSGRVSMARFSAAVKPPHPPTRMIRTRLSPPAHPATAAAPAREPRARRQRSAPEPGSRDPSPAARRGRHGHDGCPSNWWSITPSTRLNATHPARINPSCRRCGGASSPRCHARNGQPGAGRDANPGEDVKEAVHERVRLQPGDGRHRVLAACRQHVIRCGSGGGRCHRRSPQPDRRAPARCLR